MAVSDALVGGSRAINSNEKHDARQNGVWALYLMIVFRCRCELASILGGCNG